MEGTALVMRAGRGSRGGAGGSETGRSQVGEGEHRTGAVAPPLAPPLLCPPLPLLSVPIHCAVGVLVFPEVGPHTMVVAPVPVVGDSSGDSERSRAQSRDCGRSVGGFCVASE